VVDLARRRLVTGGLAASAVVVAGAGGVVSTRYSVTRRLLHDIGIVSGPDHPIPAIDAPVETGSIASKAMGRDVAYSLSVPAGAVEAVLICLHGRGGHHNDAFDNMGIHRFIAAAGLPWAAASCDGGETFWRKRADGTDAQRLVIDELLPLAQARAPGATPVVIGWSMGGYGALLAGIQRPDAFKVVVANGPSIWYSPGGSPAGAFDDDADFAANDVLASSRGLAGQPVLAEAGADDYFAGVVRDLRSRMPTIGGGLHPGFHDDATWRSFLPAQLTFIGEHLHG